MSYYDGPYLEGWYPMWDEEDDVAEADKMELRRNLLNFLNDPFSGDTFTSEIPFRIAGFVYNRPGFDDRDGIMTSLVKEVRRAENDRGPSPVYEIVTKNTTYSAMLCYATRSLF